jgi:curved DNA-binding protein CbpA
MKTHYQVLRVTEDAPIELIDASWRVLVRRFHPDNGPEASHEKTVRVNQAHDVLSDPKKREAYDAELALERAQRKPRPVDNPTRAAYPPAYPDAYPGIQFSPVDIKNVFQEAMTEGLLGAVENAGAKVLDHLVNTNPILAHYLKRKRGA